MSDGTEKRPKRRRGRRNDPYNNFYAMYYGLDEPESSQLPTRHRASAGRTGAALMAGLSALVRGRAMLVLSVGLIGVGILVVGVMVSATRLGDDPAYHPSLVDGTPTSGATSSASSSSAPASTSAAASTSAGSTTSAGEPLAGGGVDVPPVYVPPRSTVVAGPTAAPTPAGPTSTPHPTPTPTPTRTTSHPTPTPTHTTSSPTPTPTHTSSSPTPTPTPTPTPSPTKTCQVQIPGGPCIL